MSSKNAILSCYFFLCVLSLVVILTCVYHRTGVTIYSPVKRNDEQSDTISSPVKRNDGQSDTIYSPMKRNDGQSDIITNRIMKCMQTTHMDSVILSPSLMRNAESNAKYLYQEFRKVIPRKPLEGYRSYCWNENFSVHWDRSRFSGHIGNSLFDGEIEDLIIPDRGISYLNKIIPQHSFNSNLLCIPKVFLAGFPKCGSSFTHCLLNKFIFMATYGTMPSPTSLKKEPHFWVQPNLQKKLFTPTVNFLGQYLFYFLPGLKQISDLQRTDITLFDSKVNKLFMWPQFKKGQHNLTNYCILPSVLPKLFPGSKYIVVLRNPARMLYSAFWNSCSRLGERVPIATQLKGPDVFHHRVVTKIDLFNKCMRDGSIPSIAHKCELVVGVNYTACILQPERMKLLDKCAQEINFNYYTLEMPKCGRSRITMGLYYIHIRKWLSVVSRDQFHFIVLEDLIMNLRRNVHDVLEFLDVRTNTSFKDSMMKTIVDACDTNPQRAVDYKHDSRLQMREDTKTLLESFFKPFNTLLGQLVEIPGMIGRLW